MDTEICCEAPASGCTELEAREGTGPVAGCALMVYVSLAPPMFASANCRVPPVLPKFSAVGVAATVLLIAAATFITPAPVCDTVPVVVAPLLINSDRYCA